MVSLREELRVIEERRLRGIREFPNRRQNPPIELECGHAFYLPALLAILDDGGKSMRV